MKRIVVYLVMVLMFFAFPVYAIDLGEGKTLNIDVVAGTFVDVDTGESCANSDLKSVTLLRESDNWYGEATVTLKIDSIAPFVEYENRWKIYDELEVGVDYYVSDNVATRISWVNIDTEGVEETDQGFVGVKLTF
jgi:hypothetical protein